MTGHRITLPKSFKVKDGKVAKTHTFADASAAIRARKSKKQRPQKRIV